MKDICPPNVNKYVCVYREFPLRQRRQKYSRCRKLYHKTCFIYEFFYKKRTCVVTFF